MVEHVIDGCQCKGKWCPKCQQSICVGAFCKNRAKSDGLQSYCKPCGIATNHKYRSKNREKYNERANERHKRYYRENREEVNARRNAPGVRERRLEVQRSYRDSHKEQYQDWYKEHSKELMANAKRHYWNNLEQRRLKSIRDNAKRRSLKMRAGGSFTAKEWQELKDKYNYTCLCCGKCEPAIKLTADHVIPIAKGGSSEIDNIQPLCQSCNKCKGAKTIDYR